MKLYYTLAQPSSLDASSNMSLAKYFTAQNIKFELGADFARNLVKNGLIIKDDMEGFNLIRKYVVLMDAFELSAIKLSVDNVQIIENSNYIEKKNKFRRTFSWLFK